VAGALINRSYEPWATINAVSEFEVVVAAGSFRTSTPGGLTFPHRWTGEGVTVSAEFTGAHLLHLAAAGCVLNDVYREALDLGIEVEGVRVTAAGGFDTNTWASTGIEYVIEVDSSSAGEDVARLVARVDDVAEIPRAIRAGAAVTRVASER
jgi:uncharacterized OsmC-like protein